MSRREAAVTARLRAAGCVFAEQEARLLVHAGAEDALVDRRVSGEPLEHLLGWAQFCGLRIRVETGVFVPRRRTELLARASILHAGAIHDRPSVVVDLCCGSGAVATAVHAALNTVELYAVDVDPVAVRCARHNVRGTVYEGDLYEPLPLALRGRVDVLVANAPYVPSDAIAGMPPEARLHEPRVALDGGDDGLDVLRRVVAGARPWLSADGRVLVETSEGQAPLLMDAMTRSGLAPRVLRDPELGATVVIGAAVNDH